MSRRNNNYNHGGRYGGYSGYESYGGSKKKNTGYQYQPRNNERRGRQNERWENGTGGNSQSNYNENKPRYQPLRNNKDQRRIQIQAMVESLKRKRAFLNEKLRNAPKDESYKIKEISVKQINPKSIRLAPLTHLFASCGRIINDKNIVWMFGGTSWYRDKDNFFRKKNVNTFRSYHPQNKELKILSNKCEGSEIGSRWWSSLCVRDIDENDLKLILYGGLENTGFKKMTKEMFEYSINERKWEKKNFFSGKRAQKLGGHSAIYRKNSDEMFVFGGINGSQSKDYSHDIFVANMKTKKWKQLDTRFSPIGRVGHCMYWINKAKTRFLIFGGYHFRYLFNKDNKGAGNVVTYFNDAWTFDIITNKWTQLDTLGKKPYWRRYAYTCFHNNKLYVAGGFHFQFWPHGFFDDFFILDLNNNVWRHIKLKGTFLKSFGGHMDLYLDRSKYKLFTFGGNSRFFSHKNVYEFDVDKLVRKGVIREKKFYEEKYESRSTYDNAGYEDYSGIKQKQFYGKY